MDLRQVEYFVGVADHGSFTRAAQALHVSQPALSQGVRALERSLGSPLFERLNRNVLLTPAGEALLVAARQLLRDAATAQELVAAVRGLEAGRLDLVALPTLAVEPLVTILGRFRAAHPGVSVRISEPETALEAIDLIRTGACELGLVDLSGLRSPSDVVVHSEVVQELVAVCPPGSTVETMRRRPIETIVDMPLVTTPAGTSTRDLVDAAFAAAEAVPNIAVETGHRESLLPLVRAGAGATFLPMSAATPEQVGDAVVVRLQPPLRRTVGLVSRAGQLSPAAIALLEVAEVPGAG